MHFHSAEVRKALGEKTVCAVQETGAQTQGKPFGVDPPSARTQPFASKGADASARTLG